MKKMENEERNVPCRKNSAKNIKPKKEIEIFFKIENSIFFSLKTWIVT